VKKYISLARAAESSAYQADEWRRLCQTGAADCRRRGDDWFVAESELARSFNLRSFASAPPAEIGKDNPSGSTLPTPSSRRQSLILAGLLAAGILIFTWGYFNQFERPNLAVWRERLDLVAAAPAALSLADFPDLLQPLGEKLADLGELFQLLGERIITNWRYFLGLTEPLDAELAVDASSGLPILTATSSAVWQTLIDQRIASQLQSLLGGGAPAVAPAGGRANEGVVVVPVSGNERVDSAVRERLLNAFSDRVNVRFDNSGVSGVITPMFRAVQGDDYWFLLTPIRE